MTHRLPLVPPAQFAGGAPETAPGAAPINPRQEIDRILQACVIYEYRQGGALHGPQFECAARFAIGSVAVEGAAQRAPTKKAARFLADSALLDAMRAFCAAP